MAKKAKKAKKKASKKSKKKAVVLTNSNAMTKKAAQVFAECAFATGQGMEHVMAADPQNRPYALAQDAVDYWLKGHTKSIPKALRRKDANWTRDRQGVLLMAKLLGRIAGNLALAAAGTTPGTISVTRAHVDAAATQVRADTRCVAAVNALGGAGKFCDY